jgi:Replication initiator protein, pSAM2
MLGFSGHFATKSRTYSTTLGALRADRAAHQREQAIAAGLLPNLDSDTTLVVTEWQFAGRDLTLADLPGSLGLPPDERGTLPGREGVDEVA